MSKEINWEEVTPIFNFKLSRGNDCFYLEERPEINTSRCYDVKNGHRGGLYHTTEWTLHERPTKKQVKPAYTQSMFDNGEPLLVGMLFNGVDAKEVPCKCKCLAIAGEPNNLCVLYSYDEGASICSCWLNDTWVQPIDTRTDLEKMKDIIVELFNVDNNLATSEINYIDSDDTQKGIEYALDCLDYMGIDLTGTK